jgi:hypothetical protein
MARFLSACRDSVLSQAASPNLVFPGKENQISERQPSPDEKAAAFRANLTLIQISIAILQKPMKCIRYSPCT